MTGSIVYAEINSAALGRKLPVAAIKPAGQDKPRLVLFVLPGRGRHHRTLIDSAARAALLAAPFVSVLPQGEDGWYIDSPARQGDRYGAYLEEVVTWADNTFSISRAANQRGIAGWSMGGYGAVAFAQAHPGQFGFVASIIGLLDYPRPETLAEGQNYRVPVERFGAEPSSWAHFNPLNAVERLHGSTLSLVLATRGFERTMNENFLERLYAENIITRVHWLEGVHDFPLVEPAIRIVLADAAEFF